MGKDKVEAAVEEPVEVAGASQDAAATPVPPEASQSAGEVSRVSEIFAEAEQAVATGLADVREEVSRVEQVVWGWVNDHCSNSPISRATEALNYLREHAVHDLVERLKEL